MSKQFNKVPRKVKEDIKQGDVVGHIYDQKANITITHTPTLRQPFFKGSENGQPSTSVFLRDELVKKQPEPIYESDEFGTYVRTEDDDLGRDAFNDD